MKKILILFATIFLLAGFNKLEASHIPGANITWTCNPNNPLEYTFTVTIFRKCPGVLSSLDYSSSLFDITNTCGLPNPTIPTLTLLPGYPVDVNQLCPGAQSTCNGGPSSQPGVWMYKMQFTVLLSGNCDSWKINYDNCCRDASTNTNNGANNYMYTESVLNTQTAPCNNSSVVTAQPIPYYCAGQTSTYCVTSADIEGDSLYYVLVSPQGANGGVITHPSPYSATSPLQNSVWDPTTGCLTFNQPTTGNYVINIQIQSYDAFGNLTGYVNHDFQVMILSCSNQAPTPPPFITNVTGSASVNNNNIDLCIGDNVCFDVVFTDADPLDSLYITTNGTTILPGATFTQTGSNPVTGTFCWNATGGFSGSTVNFTARDQFCPIAGQTSFSVTFNIGTGVYAGPDQTICTGNTAQLQVANATNPVWTSISGDPIQVGTNISCDSCATPVITPSQTTTYVVTSDSVPGLCNLTDTVTITVLNATGPQIPDTAICAGSTVVIDAGSGYTNYTWSPACCVGQFATISVPGTYIVSVDTLVCTLTDTFVVTQAPSPTPTITGNDFYCNNDLTTLGVSGTYNSYTWNPGGQNSSSITTGTGTYTVTVTDSNGCTGTSPSVTVTNSDPQATINLPDTVCPGDYTILSVSPAFAGYEWFNGDTNATTSATAGGVSIIVTDNFGCQDTAYSTVYAYPAPNAAFSIDPPTQGQPGMPITFTDLSSGNPVSWQWNFGDGNGSTIQNPTHIYTTQGFMNVSLLVISANGCEDIVSIEYLVLSDIIIPNVFTPNGDGMNDMFVVKNLEFFNNNLTIFNRWGNKVFEKENYKNDWDGDGVSDGTYYFILEIQKYDDTVELHKGTITILK